MMGMRSEAVFRISSVSAGVRKIILHSSFFLLPCVGGQAAGGFNAAGVFLAPSECPDKGLEMPLRQWDYRAR
jgi:hypothetical protein